MCVEDQLHRKCINKHKKYHWFKRNIGFIIILLILAECCLIYGTPFDCEVVLYLICCWIASYSLLLLWTMFIHYIQCNNSFYRAKFPIAWAKFPPMSSIPFMPFNLLKGKVYDRFQLLRIKKGGSGSKDCHWCISLPKLS